MPRVCVAVGLSAAAVGRGLSAVGRAHVTPSNTTTPAPGRPLPRWGKRAAGFWGPPQRGRVEAPPRRAVARASDSFDPLTWGSANLTRLHSQGARRPPPVREASAVGDSTAARALSPREVRVGRRGRRLPRRRAHKGRVLRRARAAECSGGSVPLSAAEGGGSVQLSAAEGACCGWNVCCVQLCAADIGPSRRGAVSATVRATTGADVLRGGRA